ncbi:hypothetical protein [Streptomyces achromogenes]|uniref:hypothetical protein n=1 Tax=Streptomyces achromogenes TaxID=67255 RepID=UPI0036F74055
MAAAANVTLNIIREPGFLTSGRAAGDCIRARLVDMQKWYPVKQTLPAVPGASHTARRVVLVPEGGTVPA